MFKLPKPSPLVNEGLRRARDFSKRGRWSSWAEPGWTQIGMVDSGQSIVRADKTDWPFSSIEDARSGRCRRNEGDDSYRGDGQPQENQAPHGMPLEHGASRIEIDRSPLGMERLRLHDLRYASWVD